MKRPSRSLLLALLLVPVVVGRSTVAQDVDDDPSRRAGQLVVRGMTRAFLGDDEGAIALFSEALGLDPDDPSILGAMAEAHYRLGNGRDAVFFARRAVELRPDRTDGGLLLARLLLDAGDVTAALETLDRLAARHPGDLDVLGARAAALERAERPESARDAYRALVDVAPGDPLALERLLDLETRLGHLEEALAVAEDLGARRPGDAGIAVRRGTILVRLGRDSLAVRAFERALVLDPELREAREALLALGANAPVVGNRTGSAWVALAEEDPRNREAWIMAVRTLAREGRAVRALETGRDALLLFPGNARLEIETGLAALLAALPEEALGHFGSALRDLAERPPEVAGLESVAESGRVAAASLVGRNGSDSHLPGGGTDGDALAAIALAPVDARRAVSLAGDALARDAGGPLQVAAACFALLSAGRTGDALSVVEGPLAADPAAPLVLLFAGDALAASGRTEEADVAWRRASDGSPRSPLVRDRLGRP